MDEESLLRFLKQITVCADSEKLGRTLSQLIEILERNHTERYLIQMVKELKEFAPEATQLSKVDEKNFTLYEINKVLERGRRRKAYEEERARQGRC